MSDNADLRRGDVSTAKAALKPEFAKSSTEQVGDSLAHAGDTVASYLPGQSKARDVANPDARDPTHHHDNNGDDGLLGQAAAFVTPNAGKTTTENAKDALTPGHDSTLTPHGPGVSQNQGVLGAIGQKVTDAKDAVVGALGGANQGAHDGVKRNEL